MRLTKETAASIDKNEIASTSLTEDQEIYKENILDYYKNPRNKKELKDYTVKRKEVNPLCGDELTLYLKIDNDKISKATFLGKGCAISQASISMLTERIEGMSLREAKNLTKEDVLAMLGIPISIVRMKCALLSLKTITKSLEEKE